MSDAKNEEDRERENALDVELMLAVRDNGDVTAFRKLMECHQHAVVGTIARMLGRVDDAEDLAQQVFLRVWKSAPRYEVTAKFTTWLFTITRNLVFNETRRAYRRYEVSMDERQDRGQFEENTDSSARPDDALLRDEMLATIDKAISELPEQQRTAVILRRYQELPYEEIATILDTSVSAVKSILFRARQQLREALRDYLDE